MQILRTYPPPPSKSPKVLEADTLGLDFGYEAGILEEGRGGRVSAYPPVSGGVKSSFYRR